MKPRPAQTDSTPASRSSPTGPALRANPFPEVTDLICRLPLPTLFYTARGCSPWRPAADMGTVWHENHTRSLRFSRADTSAPDTARDAVLYGNNVPISGRTDSRESVPYKEKRTLPGTSADVSEFVCVAALDIPRKKCPSPWPGSGILTRFPFDRRWTFLLAIENVHFRTEFSYLLGPTDPCSIAVHMEPFSTSAFKVLV